MNSLYSSSSFDFHSRERTMLLHLFPDTLFTYGGAADAASPSSSSRSFSSGKGGEDRSKSTELQMKESCHEASGAEREAKRAQRADDGCTRQFRQRAKQGTL